MEHNIVALYMLGALVMFGYALGQCFGDTNTYTGPGWVYAIAGVIWSGIIAAIWPFTLGLRIYALETE